MKRILFLTQGDRQAPSSRYRVYQYLPMLEKAGLEAVVHPGLTFAEFHDTLTVEHWREGLQRIFRTFTRRVRDLHQLRDFDYVYVQRPILPAPFFNMELRIARESRLIFDLDEAIFVKRSGGMFPLNLWPQAKRVSTICRRSHRVVVASEALAQFVRRAGIEAVVLPSVVDTAAFAEGSQVSKHAHKIPVLGWVGTAVVQSDLKLVVPSLIDLHSKAPFVVRVLGGAAYSLPVRFPIEWKAWDAETEISEIAHLDIGLAPLEESEWNRYESGLRILQYWAAGVPVVASPVGIQSHLIRDGENGLFATNRRQWTENLLLLMKDLNLTRRLIAAGRKMVQEKYSLEAVGPRFLSIFQEPEKTG